MNASYLQNFQSKETELQKIKKDNDQYIKNLKESEASLSENLILIQKLTNENDVYRNTNIKFIHDLNEAKTLYENDRNKYFEEKKIIETEILKLKNDNKRLTDLLETNLQSKQDENLLEEIKTLKNFLDKIQNDLKAKNNEIKRLRQEFISEKTNLELERFQELNKKLSEENKDLKEKIKCLLIG